jgi:hypothetical protein
VKVDNGSVNQQKKENLMGFVAEIGGLDLGQCGLEDLEAVTKLTGCR